jgi:hypothetical protein
VQDQDPRIASMGKKNLRVNPKIDAPLEFHLLGLLSSQESVSVLGMRLERDGKKISAREALNIKAIPIPPFNSQIQRKRN